MRTMKKLICKLTITMALAFCISTVSIAQITKSDIETMLTYNNISTDAIKKIFLRNEKDVKDGRLVFKDVTLENTKITLTESGILFFSDRSTSFYPYSSIQSLWIVETTLYLEQ